MYRKIIILIISIMIAYTNVYSAQILGGVPCDESEAKGYDQCIIEFK